VLYSDFGYTTAPFTIQYDFEKGLNKLRYKNSFRPILGLGGSYKWFALRIGFALPGTRFEDKYGKTNYFNLGGDFSVKKFYFDLHVRNYSGYAIKDAYKWNDSLHLTNPNDIRAKTRATSLSVNTWYFQSKDFKMHAVRGKTGHYDSEVRTWYVKNTLNLYSIGNNGESIIPNELIDIHNSKTSSDKYSTFELGFIPGYAYVNRWSNWQVSALIGFGPVVQAKFYNVNSKSRGFIGLAPRFDFKFIAGYSIPKYFVFLETDFDNRSIRFGDLKYKQYFYTIRLIGGIRLDKKKKQ
jgi:hypothetical protein